MFKKIKSSQEYNHKTKKNDHCYCNDNNKSCRIIENYRSILDRKQTSISSWKVLNQNEKNSFMRGTKFRKGTDALVIRLNHICLIHPWYKYIDINKNLLSTLKQNQYNRIFEIILLECDCSIGSHEYELAVITCPCIEQMRTYCTYCRLTLTATEKSDNIPSDKLLNDVNQQTEQILQIINASTRSISVTRELTNISKSLMMLQSFDENTADSPSETESIVLLQNNNIKQGSSHSIIEGHSSNSSVPFPYHLPAPHSLEHSSTVESTEDLTLDTSATSISRATQTKLFAILLPQSLLSEMQPAKIVTKTSRNITRICQVNTLSYLIKLNDNQTEKHYLRKDIRDVKTRVIKDFISKEKTFNIKSSLEMIHQIPTDCQPYDHGINIPTIKFEEDELLDNSNKEKFNSLSIKEHILPINQPPKDFVFTSSALKCVNTFNATDLDEPVLLVSSSLLHKNMTSSRTLCDKHDRHDLQSIQTNNFVHTDTQLTVNSQSFNNSNNQIIKCSNNSNNNSQIICNQINNTLVSSDHKSSTQHEISKLFHLKHNRYRILPQKRQKYRNKKHIYAFLQRLHRRRKKKLSQLHHSLSHSTDYYNQLFPPESNSLTHHTSSIQSQQSIVDVHINNSDIPHQYKSHEHTIVARASKNSTARKQIQLLLNNHDTSLEDLIDLQLRLTCNENYRSVCILIDDHKQSERYRSSFLRYIYTTLSNTLKTISTDDSIQLKCTNLVFFQNSFYDMINMQRLRLIDTGKQILLLPSCEISLKTSNDINIVLNRLSPKMLFAHQILIINFYHNRLSLSGSFLFLQLSPICSIHPTGLLTNLNSSTYSVLNLIRQINNGELFKHNTPKRYLLNDCLLNRLLKSYLFSTKQIMTVLTVKSQ